MQGPSAEAGGADKANHRSTGERLQKVMAAAGVASRRACENLIREGRVRVNGQVVTRLGTRVDPLRDRIEVDGRLLTVPATQPLVYLMMNKPKGVLTTLRDPRGEPTVADLLPPEVKERGPRLFPVGRLDRDSRGLLLFTNDGELAARLLHPRYQVPKTYRVEVEGHPSAEDIRRLRRGVMLEDGVTGPAEVSVVSRRAGTSVLDIVIREGRKRQVRRMLQAVDHPVIELTRIGFGPLRLGRLPEGSVRRLQRRERDAMRAMARRKAQTAAERR